MILCPSGQVRGEGTPPAALPLGCCGGPATLLPGVGAPSPGPGVLLLLRRLPPPTIRSKILPSFTLVQTGEHQLWGEATVHGAKLCVSSFCDVIYHRSLGTELRPSTHFS